MKKESKLNFIDLIKYNNGISNKKRRFASQDFIDKKIKKSPVIINGHNYVLYEYGGRHERNYSFELEHSIECKKCYEIFD